MTPEEVHRVASECLMQMVLQVLFSPDAMGSKLLEPTARTTQPAPQQPATGNTVIMPVVSIQPVANCSPQRTTPPQGGVQPPAYASGG